MNKNYYREINKISNHQLKIQNDYYKEIVHNTISLREFKHNYRNQLLVLQTYIDNNEFESASQYIKNSYNFIGQTSVFQTGNYVLDALLSEKSKIANNNNTYIECTGMLLNNILDHVDLSVIFGNAIDNAIEACEQLDINSKKKINITLKSMNNLIAISISNPIKEKVTFENNTIHTTKQDQSDHGFGLYSIRRVTKKYNGEIIIDCSENFFTLNIYLYS